MNSSGLKMGSIYCTNLIATLAFTLALLALTSSAAVGKTTSTTSFELGRRLLQVENGSEPLKQSDDTIRVDPLDSLKKYRGGYNLTNKHYWSSTIFTGIYGYAFGVLWLLVGLVYGVFLLVTTCCCKNKKSGKLRKKSSCRKQFHLWPIALATFFTILAIVASGLVLGGNAKFRSRAKAVVNIIMKTANEASNTIHNTTGAMKTIRDDLEATSEGNGASVFLTSTSEKLDDEAAEIQKQARKNRRLIDKGLKIVYILTSLTISLTLTAVVALSISGFLRLQRAVNLLIIVCWLLTVLCWLFFGMYFFIEKFSGDTCTAIEEFQRDPYNNSLSSILPCNELRSAKSVLVDVSGGIYDLVNQVNSNISLLQASDNSNLVKVCNPFSAPPEYQYQPDNCPSNTIQIGDIPQVLKAFTCSDANNETCKEGEFISNSDYKTVEAYISSIQTLLNAYPGMESLVECESVKDAFSEILLKHCKPLRKYVKMVWAAMVFLSMIMVVLVLIWTIKAHHEHRPHLANGSVKPHSAAANRMELETAKAIKDSSNLNSDV